MCNLGYRTLRKRTHADADDFAGENIPIRCQIIRAIVYKLARPPAQARGISWKRSFVKNVVFEQPCPVRPGCNIVVDVDL